MQRLARLLLLLGALEGASLAPCTAPAQEPKNTRPVLNPPPPAMPFRGSVARGERLEIPLRIYGVKSETLRYLIKKPPLHGRLSEPRAVSREVWTVTYEPPPDLGVTADRFTYSVQNHAGVSAPVEVTISITDLPTQFAVPASIDFGELLAGDRAVREIEISNRGGGLIEGTIEVDPPLRIEGRARYRLEAGDYTYVKVVFAPTEGGTFRREIRYSSHREFITSVSGVAQMPVSVEPNRVELRHDPGSAIRTGSFEVVNRTGDERTFKVTGGERLKVPAEITVPARGRVAVPVSLAAEDVAALPAGEARLESSGFALAVPVRSEAVGPILQLPRPSVALGRVDASRGGIGTVEIRNVGGTAAQVTSEAAAPFSLVEPTFSILPGETKRLGVQIAAGEPQRYRTWLKFTTRGITTELELEAELIGAMGASTREESPSEASKPAVVRPPEIIPWMPDLNLARSIRVTRVKQTTADVEWPVELNGAGAYRIQRLILTRNKAGELRNTWTEIPGTTFARRDPLWIGSLSGLEPGQSQTIRVVALTPEGALADTLFRLDFYTPPRTPWPRPRLLPSLTLLALAIGAFLVFRRLKRHYSEPISGF